MKELRFIAATACAFALAGDCVPADSPHSRYTIQWLAPEADTNSTVVEVSGIDASILQELGRIKWGQSDWHRVLAVHSEQVDSPQIRSLPPMLGAYTITPNALRFLPQFPLAPGVNYSATFQPAALPGGRAKEQAISCAYRAMAPPSGPKTVVSHIYPSASSLPENLLKFYVQFSGPMNRGYIYDHIHLRDSKGKNVDLPFLEIDEELWNSEMTRLTLFIDPGRIKRGVRPLEEIGPALLNGKSFTLVIDSDWRDSGGRPLKAGFKKRFRVGPPDREPPDPAKWKIEPPTSGNRHPLLVKFPEPLDYALALRVIKVADGLGNILPGETALSDNERRWMFTPAAGWARGRHQLLVPTTIEDLAGNNIGKAFDVDLFEGVERQFTNSVVRIPFVVP